MESFLSNNSGVSCLSFKSGTAIPIPACHQTLTARMSILAAGIDPAVPVRLVASINSDERSRSDFSEKLAGSYSPFAADIEIPVDLYLSEIAESVSIFVSVMAGMT